MTRALREHAMPSVVATLHVSWDLTTIKNTIFIIGLNIYIKIDAI